jgi:hypothetical protein
MNSKKSEKCASAQQARNGGVTLSMDLISWGYGNKYSSLDWVVSMGTFCIFKKGKDETCNSGSSRQQAVI